MKKLAMMFVGILMISQLQAELFTRMDTLNMEANLSVNTGGIGNMVAGVDLDGDGLVEIYMVNDNWNDVASELVPKIFKYEKSATGVWELVWSATAPINLVEAQNTWPTLSVTDLDNDGKMELTWGIVNNLVSNLNPARILVYEQADGDNLGVNNGGVWEPNSHWSITDEDSKNIRPVNWKIVDIDSDGVDEILFAGRKSDLTFCIASVDNIPDNGDGSEDWTMEFELPGIEDYTGDNKWDVAVIDNRVYIFDEVEISKVTWDGTDYVYSSLAPLPGGFSFDAVQVCDVDGDGDKEMLTGEYYYGDATRNIWLLEEDGDTLKRTVLFDLAGHDYLNGGRLIGGAMGDIDMDGTMDFVFGSRNSGLSNGMIFRVEYQGGDIENSSNWELSIIDSAFAYVDLASGGIWNVIEIANIDDDKGLEVLYTSSVSIPYSVEYASTNISAPVIMLDSPNTDPIVVSVNPTGSLPSAYHLSQNYPNPFNPTTTISFSIPKNEFVTVKIVDITGQTVATLISTNLVAGDHSIIWNGTNSAGHKVASGIYKYTLSTSSHQETKVMTLLK